MSNIDRYIMLGILIYMVIGYATMRITPLVWEGPYNASKHTEEYWTFQKYCGPESVAKLQRFAYFIFWPIVLPRMLIWRFSKLFKSR